MHSEAKHIVKLVDFRSPRKERARILLTQPRWDETDWVRDDGLFFQQKEDKARDIVEAALATAQNCDVDLVAFPEISIPPSLIPILTGWTKQNECIVIAGSHYQRVPKGYLARCPIIFDGETYICDKVVPAPIEISPLPDEGLQSGENLIVFQNTAVGTFSVLICSDYVIQGLKESLFEYDLDLLIVPSFQNKSDLYHKRMDIDCENAENGLYIAYLNNVMKDAGDGRSAFFGQMNRTFLEKFLGKVTDGTPETKIIEFTPEIDSIVVGFDTRNKRPSVGKNVLSRPNIEIVEIKSRNTVKAPAKRERGPRVEGLRRDLFALVERLIARHGLDDDLWLQAPSSQLFLSQIAQRLGYQGTDENNNLVDAFLRSFTPNHDDSLTLVDNRVLITPEESLKIVESMKQEDQKDGYFRNSGKTNATNIDPTRLHLNYFYGVALGVSALSRSSFMRSIADSAINYLIYQKNPSPLDNHGGWYPYRVPWITARILISFSSVDLTNRPDRQNIEDVLQAGLESLIDRLGSNGYWKSGVGDWVTTIESTALCLEAFLKSDRDLRFRMVVDQLVERIASDQSWLKSPPNFSDQASSNQTLSVVLLISVLLQATENYSKRDLLSEEQEIEYLNFLIRTLLLLLEPDQIEIQQFCTIPQILAYSMM